MINKLNVFLILLFSVVFSSIFYRWFFQSEIIGGDWPFYFKEFIKDHYLLIPSWSTWYGNGLGGMSPLYSLDMFNNLTKSFVYFFGISWVITYKIFWFGLFIFLSMFSSMYFVHTVLQKSTLWQKLIGALVFTTNTYILMVVSGGQMGVALAYSVAPLVLGVFIKLINIFDTSDFSSKFKIKTLKLSIIAGCVLAGQVMFDPRIAYITMIAVVLFVLINLQKTLRGNIYMIIFIFVIPSLVAILLHASWIFPILVTKQSSLNDLGNAYTGSGIVKFLSFSTFSQSISILHPNWPENIFGKVYFMKPEFLFIPLIAYSFFIFSEKKYIFSKVILSLALLGILGSFLGKGANEPFGTLYIWLFKNIPGFLLFRDPTKFYLLTVLSYSILIPLSIYYICERFKSNYYPSSLLKTKIQHYLPIFFVCLFVGYWIFLIWPSVSGQLGGTFKKHEVPQEYIVLKDFLMGQSSFSRTLWVPRQQRFTFFSVNHPSIEASTLFNATSSAQIINKLKEKHTRQYLSDLSVKYIIVPYDSLGEFFLTDRKYDKSIPRKIANDLREISWLREINGFGNISVFEVPFPKEHFWLEKSGYVSYAMMSPTLYEVNISISQDQNMIFSERYNPYWVAQTKNKTFNSKETVRGLNSFNLPKGKYSLKIFFLQEKLYNFGNLISFLTFLTLITFLVVSRGKKNS